MARAVRDNSHLFIHDEELFSEYGYVCGTDEAGRGPLAGPVFAATVVFEPGTRIEGLDDSKKLTEKKREKLYDEIIGKALAYHIEPASVMEIEEKNILNASLSAMRRSVDALNVLPGIVLIDGSVCRGFDGYNAHSLVKGDAKSAAIAAASVLAKVTRDRYMVELDKLCPGYGFSAHKGYPTAAHYEAIKSLGISEFHRRSFLKNLDTK
jgi:ribonuclease HII